MNKFNASFTGPDVFHLDNEFVVPVEMMKANLYPLSWFTLESQDIQVGISRALQVFIGISSCCGILTNCKHSLQKTQMFFLNRHSTQKFNNHSLSLLPARMLNLHF